MRKTFESKMEEKREWLEIFYSEQFRDFTLHEILFGYQIKEGVMGGACNKYWREKKCIQVFDKETWGKETISKTKT